MAVESPEILDIPIIASIQNTVDLVAEPNTAIASNTVTPSSETHLKKSFSSDEIKKWVPDNQNLNTFSEETKVSALSLASIRAKRELLENTKSITKETVHLPTEPFTETDMLLHWNKYAQKLGDKGFRIMESLLLINDPVLNGTAITLELPNEGSKIEFESEINGLLGHLKGHLHNHDISITVIVNESVENKFAFTPQDKYNRLKEINPNLELLRKTFDLDF